MHYLTKEKTKVLAERNGWSLPRAEGYVDGEVHRRRGLTPSRYVQVGIDEYCLGFRAGYYDRKGPEQEHPKTTAAPAARPAADAVKGAQELK
jgi:hypothetical protein